MVGRREQQREKELRDRRPGQEHGHVGIRSWITLDDGAEALQRCRQDYDQLKKAALSKDFKPVSLGAKAIFLCRTKSRTSSRTTSSASSKAAIRQRKDEYIIYSAHWDHLGRDPKLNGDQIYNGALDNASGIASILEIAQAFTKLPQPPPRSLLFMATTAEEAGLLGAKYYAENPLYPLDHTLADINIDGINCLG